MSTPCPFCTLADERIVAGNQLAVVIRDGFPVSPGHTLVVPRRHVASWFDATAEEQLAILDLLAEVKQQLDAEHSPAGYNIGINDGPAAGQTIRHLHMHLIPRYDGDTEDPRGGVRWVFPHRAAYWKE
jgi:diadenosine tetraphosphate (Ap4A) HIT family hydrolase